MVDLKEIQKDLGKVKRNRKIYLLAAVGMSAIFVVLLILFIVKHDIPALLLCIVAFVWGAILLNQSLKSRDYVDLLEAKISEVEGVKEIEGGTPPSGPGPPSGEGGEPGEP